MSGYLQTNQTLKLIYVDSNINEADTGKILMTPRTVGAVDVTYTLPALKQGLHYRFINGSTAALSGDVIITAGAADIYGSLINGPTGGTEFVDVDAKTTIQFVDAKSLLGDYIDLYCDGTYWYVDGKSVVSQGISVA